MKKFLQQVITSTIGSFAGLLLFLIVTGGGFFVLLVAALMSTSDTAPKVQSESVLVFNLSNQISDYQNTNDFASFFDENNQKLNLREVTTAITKAATDSNITALYLDGSRGNAITGYGSLSEIREALEIFRESGKKIIAYNVSASEKDYYLASVADEITLNPMGFMEVNGLASSQLFFGNALEKYGIGVQIIRVGKYKSAIEPFILDNYSAESKEQTEQLLGDIWENFLDTASKDRDITREQLNNIANESGILDGQKAVALNVIDQVAYQDEIIDKFNTINESADASNFRQVSIRNYLNMNPTPAQSSKNQIAILYLEGAIVDGEGESNQIGSSRFVSEIRRMRQNENIKGVVVRINSPGGSAVASELILRELQLIAAEKPVVISMGDVAASGGYWIATSGEKIFANDSTITGSIGVFGVLFNISELANNNGITNGVVKTNPFADLGNGFSPKSEAELAIYQNSVNRIYDLFLNKVSEARDLPLEEVAEIAQGRVWSGVTAKEIGLVDEIGGLNKAIDYLNEQLELDGQYQIVNYPAKKNFETEFFKRLGNANIEVNMGDQQLLKQLFKQYYNEIELQQMLENPYRVYSILPYKLNIE